MAIAIIQDWIDGDKPFDEGVAIYKKYGDNEALMEIFECGRNRFSIRKLEEALTQINNTKQEANLIKENVNRDTLPEDLKILHTNTMNQFKDMATRQQNLENDMSEEERFKLAAEILNADDVIHANFEVIDHFKETGQRIETPVKKKRRGKPVEEMNNAELANALKAIPTYITKEKKKLKQPDIAPGDVLTINNKIAMYQHDLEYAKTKLSA